MRPYQGLAPYYDLLYERGVGLDFAEEDRRLLAEIRRYAPHAKTLLEVACGTGAHLENLRRDFSVEGLDLSREMLAVAHRRLPRVPLHEGDLLTFDLGRRFDAVVCLFSSVAYVKTLPRLRRAIANLARHVTPGGALIVDGWLEPDAWRAGHVSVDQATDGDATIVRLSLASRRANLSIMDWHFLLARRGRVEHFAEHHEVGLFERHEYSEAMESAGLVVETDPAGAHGRGRYFGRFAP